MRFKKVRSFMICLVSLALLYGCGSSHKEGTSAGGDPLLGGVATVGDPSCYQCHASSADPVTGETFITQYQRSLHANLGCESCHGGGAQHNGVGPLPYTLNSETSDADIAARCVQCHNGTTTFKGEVAPLTSSPNFSNGNHANPFSAEEAHEAICARCHSHEGSILYGQAGLTGDRNVITNSAYQPVLGRDPETFNTMMCATCHEHGGNIRQSNARAADGSVVAWDPNGNKVADQYDLCTSCHTYKNIDGVLIGSGNTLTIATTAGGTTNVPTAPYYHNTRWFRTLPSTHYDQPASGTTLSNGTLIEGYVFRNSSQTKTPCFDCHGHEYKANTRALVDRPERGATTFTDWAQSAHAGRLLSQKLAAATGLSGAAQVDAVMKAGVTEESGAAWSHYNWDDTANRGSCQRCHTATGASNFMKDPANYAADGSGNSFTHLAGWTTSNKKSDQQELLYCWGCHSNPGAGKLYAPGARTETYAAVSNATTGTTGTSVTISYPDIKGSNVCMTCHVGREVGENIKSIVDNDGVLSFVNSHYLTAGAQLFGQSGYTYSGRSYAAPSYFQHDKIGTSAAPGTGSNGPCAGCHMSSPNKHRFTNVSSSGDSIVKITSSTCVACHQGQYALTPTALNDEAEEYEASLSSLAAVLASKGIFFDHSTNPYFFKDSNGNGVLDPGEIIRTNAYTNWAGPYGVGLFKDTMGAAFNLNLLAHDPGGYAHNRIYAKRLIWDSIDFSSDGTLNNDVIAAIDAQVTAGRITSEVATAAKAYLGSSRP
jgi:hypothetical protein